ncbi:MAG: PKD domain-containing protein [Baekduia sp.]
MTSRRPFLAALLTAAACTAPIPSAGAAAPSWGTPEPISSPAAATGWPKISAADDGTVSVIWAQSDGSHLRLAQRTRIAAGAWTPVSYISPAGIDISGYGSYQLATAADGSASVAFGNSDFSVVYASTRQPGSSQWSTAASFADSGESFEGGYTVAGPGSAMAGVNLSNLSGDKRLRIRTRPAGSDDFSVTGEIDLPDDAGYANPRLAYNSHGDAVATWWKNPYSGTPEMQGATYDAGNGDWSPIATIATTDGNGTQDPALAFNDDGDAAMVWSSGTATDVHVASLDGSSGVWTDGGSKFVAGPNAVLTRIAADHDGQFVALWQEFDFSDDLLLPRALMTTFDTATGQWSPTEDLIGPNGGAATLTADGSGNITAVVFGIDGGVPALVGLHRPSGGDFGSGEVLSSANPIATGPVPGIPAIATDRRGNAFAAWATTDTTIAVVVGDAFGPTLSAVSVPQTAVAGERVSFSVSPFDLWSGVETTNWSFGDGSEATGSSVGHTYAAGGTYTVRVTSSDLSGQSTTTTRTITVSDPPAPPADDADDADDAPPVVIPPVIEARLSGRTITLNAKLTLKKGKRCSGTVRATTAFGGRSYKTTLRLASKNGACRATGTIKLKKTPSLRSKLRVTISGSQAKSRTLTTRRG